MSLGFGKEIQALSWEFPLIHAVVGILVNTVGEVLIAQRPPSKPYAGYWEFPGGKVEPGEEPFSALRRELKEELAIDVLAAYPWQQCKHAYPDKVVFLDVWKISQYQGQPCGLEGQEGRWGLPMEITSFRILEGNFQLVKQLIAAGLVEG